MYRAFLCLDAADTQCADISPGGAYGVNAHIRSYDLEQVGLPATTTFHLAVYVDDESTGGTYAALNPSRYLMTRSATITYY